MSSAADRPMIALLHGPDRPGLVARVAGWIFERGGNILHAEQHRDREAGVFFQRIEWIPARPDYTVESQAFLEFAHGLGMSARVASSDQRLRVAIFVSKFDHCFHDLVLRWKAGEYACDLTLVVSNHADLEGIAVGYGLPFCVIPIAAAAKAAGEAKQLQLVQENRIDLIILARYMQILSNEFLGAFARPVINIHHSFLP